MHPHSSRLDLKKVKSIFPPKKFSTKIFYSGCFSSLHSPSPTARLLTEMFLLCVLTSPSPPVSVRLNYCERLHKTTINEVLGAERKVNKGGEIRVSPPPPLPPPPPPSPPPCRHTSTHTYLQQIGERKDVKKLEINKVQRFFPYRYTYFFSREKRGVSLNNITARESSKATPLGSCQRNSPCPILICISTLSSHFLL